MIFSHISIIHILKAMEPRNTLAIRYQCRGLKWRLQEFYLHSGLKMDLDVTPSHIRWNHFAYLLHSPTHIWYETTLNARINKPFFRMYHHKDCVFYQIVQDKPNGMVARAPLLLPTFFRWRTSRLFWESSNGFLDGEVASAEKGRCDCCKGGTEKGGC